MGILLLSWNLSFLISKMVLKCLSPGQKSASTHHVAFLLLVVKHFDCYPRLSHRIVGGFNGVNGKHLQGEAPDWACTSGSSAPINHVIISSPVILLLLLLITTTKVQWELPDRRTASLMG